MSELALAVDIGGTKILVGLVDGAGEVAALERLPTPAREGAEAIIAAVLAGARKVLASTSRSVVGCGVGTAGVVGADGEIASATDHLAGWAGTPLRARLADGLGMKVTVLNDVHATGLAEARLGAARACGSALIVAVGTGIGGAIVRDGQVVRGAHGIAGSVGHLASPLRLGRRCSCGAVDHVEAYASGPALEREYFRRTGRDLDLRRLAALIEAGDEVARSVIVQGAEALGAAIGGANNLVDAEMIIVGGGVASLGEVFFGPLRHAAASEALGATRTVPIVPAQFGAMACLIGAGLAALSSR